MNKTFLFENYQIAVELQGDSTIKVINNSNKLYHIHFKNPQTYYSGYVDYNFKPGYWVLSNPKDWEHPLNKDIVFIEVIDVNTLLLLQVNILTQEVTDISNASIKVKNYVVSPNYTSIIISAFQAQDFIKETINSLLNQETHYQKIEILIGVDACKNTLYSLLLDPLPENVSIYLFEQNVGPYAIFNTLVTLSKNDNILFFGADDISTKDLIENFSKNIEKNAVIRWGCYKFSNGKDYTNPKNLTYQSLPVGGCVGMTKDLFFSVKGYHKWRASADDEFNRRIQSQGKKLIDLDLPLFYYRQHKNSLSHHYLTTQGSILRMTYRSLINTKSINKDYPNPIRLHTEPCIKVF